MGTLKSTNPNDPTSLESVKQMIEDNNFSDLFIDTTGFVEALEPWVVPGVDRIVSARSDVEQGNVIILAEQNWDESMKMKLNMEHCRYKIVRAFKIGNNWGVSIDHEGLEPEEAMHELLANIR